MKTKINSWSKLSVSLVFWLVFMLMPFLTMVDAWRVLKQPGIFQGLAATNLLLMAVFYLNAYVLYPLLTKPGGKIYYFVLIVVTAVVFVGLSTFLIPEIKLSPFDNRSQASASFPNSPRSPNRSFVLLPFVFIVICSLGFRLFSDRSLQGKKMKELQTLQLETELNFLRSQISPHFMFNLLNTMVSMARKKSDLLESALLNLSGMMRYMLYENQGRAASLSQEVEYLKAYIELQLLRFGEVIQINFFVNGQLDRYELEPMLLIPFVENAFKHGTGDLEHPVIDISLTLEDTTDELIFKVVNGISAGKRAIDFRSGIGLINVRRRLAILFPDRYELTARPYHGVFEAQLKLKLK